MSIGMNPGNRDFELSNLADRPRYKSRGVCSPLYGALFLLMMGIMFGSGALASAVARGTSLLEPPSGKEDAMILITGMAGFLSHLFCLLPAIIGIWAFKKGKVRSWLLALCSAFAWSGAYYFGMLAVGFQGFMDKLTESDPMVIMYLFFLGPIIFAVGVGIFQITCSEAFRVFYDDRDQWGEQHFAFFKSGKAKEVAAFLELGSLQELMVLKADGPNAGGPAWQSFTSAVVTIPQGDPSGPAYLHVKSSYLGGGPLFSTRIHSCLGYASLRHVELKPDELRRLAWLFPSLDVPGGSPAMPGPTWSHPHQETRVAQTKSVAPLKGRILGLPAGVTAQRVESPNGSFIEMLAPPEKRQLTGRFWLGFGSMFLMMGLVFVFAALMAFLEEAFKPMPDWLTAITVVAALGLVLGMLLCGFFFARIARSFVMRGVKSRPEALFIPGKKSVAIAVEESSTFAVTKFLPDDYALMQPSAESLDIEFSGFRAHLDRRDVKLDYHTVPSGTSLRIFARFPEGEWSITVSTQQYMWGWALFIGAKKKAEWLWKRIYEEMNQPGAGGGSAATGL